jgi:Lrp/AsnC family transcriptional regulator, leucine-responsive regulatory protein
MTFKPDLKDRKILSLLDENSRYTNTQIAKKVGLSKPAVEYRLQRFEKNGVIFSYYTIIDFTKLGYSQYKIYFKFQNASPEDEQKIVKYWNGQKNIIWLAQVRGRWDLAVSVLARNNFEFGSILADFSGEFSRFILEKDVLLLEYSPYYSRKYMESSKYHEFVYSAPEKLHELDDIDKKILKELSVNARINIVDLADELNLTRDIVNYRIKKMTESKVISQYRCYLNLNKIGINHYKIILRTKNFDSVHEKKLKQYTDSHKKIVQMLKLIGSWDLEIELEMESEDELYQVLNDLRNRFSDIIRDYDILRITETYKFDFFPF